MSREILCTVGTSLLTNRDDRPWSGWDPRNKGPLPDPLIVDTWLGRADPFRASAETNTLARLDLTETDSLVFLHSDTQESLFCAERLRTFYEAKVREASLERIGKLGYGADQFTSGLKALVDLVLRRVHRAQKRGKQPVFCATGGFKAEIAFLNVMGALLGIEVVYIHELHRELVRFPRLPLTWDDAFVGNYEDFFRWIDEEPRKSIEVESWLKGRPELRSLVEDGEDGYTYLSAAGNLLYRVAKEKGSMPAPVHWPEPDWRPPEEKNFVSATEHHRPSGWERFVHRLCSIDCVTAVRYGPEVQGGPRVKILDAARGIIGIRFGERGNELPLKVETTAKDPKQTERVAQYLRGLK